MADLLKIADALEKAAAYFDSVEEAHAASVKTAHDATVKDLSAKYTKATGEELPAETLEKLASGDKAVLQTVETVISKTASAVESMGRSSERPGEAPPPQNKQERAKAAWDRFGQFATS